MKNRNFNIIFLVATLLLSTFSASAENETQRQDSLMNEDSKSVSQRDWNGWGYGCRLGFTIGGITPVPLSAEIREMMTFSPNGAFMQEFYGYKLFKERFGFYFGERLAIEGMNVEARVKNYHMSIEQGGDYISGYFTGVDKTEAKLISVKIPIEFMARVNSRLDLRVGPYIQINLHREFKGEVYDGYLRENTPTGQKIIFSDGSKATYDFSEDVKKTCFGAEVAADFEIKNNFGVFANLDYGFRSVFPDDFETISFKMYPIFFSVGLYKTIPHYSRK
ncbi:MAG: outer membrane beta-barrel protein [Bacteroidales bacterium]|nr:outer membrane beta-barrel protein [Bacteroidales bacterium]